MIKPALEAATTLPLTAADESDAALARGAARASANAPLFASSTSALAYAQDPGTGAIDPFAVAPGYFESLADAGANDLAYSAVPDDFSGAFTVERAAATPLMGTGYRDPKSFRLVGSALAAIFVVGVAALVASLAIAIRPTAAVRPSPEQHVVAPTQAAPAPAANAPAPAAPAPAPAPVAQVPAPAPAPIPEAPAAVPVPEAPAPAPPPPMAPAPVPIPLPLPRIFGGPPDGGPHGGGPFGGPFGHGPFGGGGHGGFGGGHGGFGRGD
jgi:hypothetical protein